MTSLLNLIENKDLNMDQTDVYAAILGESPSKGARSPVLWNAAFRELSVPGMMHPMDVTPDNLSDIVRCLKEDSRFIGGAVTMPFKIEIMPYLDDIESEARIIGAVNCLYRQGTKIIGANTDGAGALWSLQETIKEPLKEKTVLIIGTGGAGFSVASYIASEIGFDGQLLLANRSQETLTVLSEKLKAICNVQIIPGWPLAPDLLPGIDILINCTSIGFSGTKIRASGVYSLKYYSPLGPVDDSIVVPDRAGAEKTYAQKASEAIALNVKSTLEMLSMMSNPLVFDIIYQPKQTLLLSVAKLMNFRILNGLPMNLEQAVIAFDKATESKGLRTSDTDEVRQVMRKQ